MISLSKNHLGMTVLVDWLDSSAIRGWNEVQEGGLLRCRSVGFLVFTASDRIILSGGATEFGQYDNQFIIPRAVITGVRILDRKAIKF